MGRLYGEQFLSRVGKEELGPLYLLAGEEAVGRERTLETFEERLVEPASRAFNFTRMHGDETSVGELVDLARTLPMMAARRLIVVLDVERCKGKLQELQAYLDDPNPSTCLVACTTGRVRPPRGKKYGARDTILTTLSRRATLVEYYPPFRDRRLSWLNSYARSLGLELERGAAELLLERMGDDTAAMAAELPKLDLFASGQRIRREHVAQLLGRDSVDTWDLVNALCRRDVARAFRTFRRLAGQGSAGFELVSPIAMGLRRLLQAQSLRAAGAPPAVVTRQLGIHGLDRQREIQAQLGRYSVDELAAALVRLQGLELAIKSGQSSPPGAVEQFLLDTLRTARVHPRGVVVRTT